MDLGYNGKKIGDKLKELLTLCQTQPEYNEKEFLLSKAKKEVKKA